METTNRVPFKLCWMLWLLIVSYGCGIPFLEAESTPQSDDTYQQLRLKKLTPYLEKTLDSLSVMFTAEKHVGENFKALRKILSSKAYTKFLKTEYPGDFKNFEEFVAYPGAETVKVERICQKYIPKVSKQDIERANAEYWGMRDVAVKMPNEPQEKRYEAMIQVMFPPKPKSEADMWWQKRFELDFIALSEFGGMLMEMAEKDEIAERFFIRDVIKRYETDEGLLRLAVINPKVVGRILKRFKSPKTLEKWLAPADNREKETQ